MKRLIITADDLGLCRSVNDGIIRSVSDGVVSYVNIIPSGEAFDDAVQRLKPSGITEAGAHLALTETRPVSDPQKVPTLVGKNGAFPKNNTSFFLKLFSGRINMDEAYRELKAQLEKASGTGVKITSLSSHEHIHMMPQVLRLFIRLASEYKIPCIRRVNGDRLYYPLSAKKLYKFFALKAVENVSRGLFTGSGLSYTDRVFGFIGSGGMDEKALSAVIRDLPDGTSEIVCHPGFLSPEVVKKYTFHKNCESELHALTSPRIRRMINDAGAEIITFSRLSQA